MTLPASNQYGPPSSEPPKDLRAAAWLLIVAGGLLWLSELGLRIIPVIMVALVLAVVAGLYLVVRAWRRPPGLRWLGLGGPLCAAVYRYGGIVGHVAGGMALVFLGIAVLRKTR